MELIIGGGGSTNVRLLGRRMQHVPATVSCAAEPRPLMSMLILLLIIESRSIHSSRSSKAKELRSIQFPSREYPPFSTGKSMAHLFRVA